MHFQVKRNLCAPPEDAVLAVSTTVPGLVASVQMSVHTCPVAIIITRVLQIGRARSSCYKLPIWLVPFERFERSLNALEGIVSHDVREVSKIVSGVIANPPPTSAAC